MKQQTPHSTTRTRIATIFALVVVIACLVMAGCSNGQSSANKSDSLSASGDISASSSEQLPENPIKFDEYIAINDDIYGWLNVPDTKVDGPILQNRLLDNYYLVHDMYGNDSVAGAFYTQSCNERDFKDPVTLIYGHTFETWQEEYADEAMGTLHYFEDPEFFNSHDTFYIYTPNSILTYKIVSAYEYDNRHIMNSFDFSDPAVQQEYFNYVVSPDSMVKNVRPDTTLTAGADHIVQLSTCTRPANDDARYIITGVLVNEQQTR